MSPGASRHRSSVRRRSLLLFSSSFSSSFLLVFSPAPVSRFHVYARPKLDHTARMVQLQVPGEARRVGLRAEVINDLQIMRLAQQMP